MLDGLSVARNFLSFFDETKITSFLDNLRNDLQIHDDTDPRRSTDYRDLLFSKEKEKKKQIRRCRDSLLFLNLVIWNNIQNISLRTILQRYTSYAKWPNGS